jgi:dolichol-phosphate mannosyltransferase
LKTIVPREDDISLHKRSPFRQSQDYTASMTDTIVVLPTYNEAGNIERTVREVFAALPHARIVVVDDSSPDGTGLIVSLLQKEFPALQLHTRLATEGLGAAYKDILSRLQSDPSVNALVHLDVDGSHESCEIGHMLSLLERYDLVIGSRYVSGGSVKGWELTRRLLSRLGNAYARIVTGIPLHDVSSGFIAIRKALLDQVDFARLSGTGYAYQMEFKYECVVRLHARAFEHPIHFKPRREGESKISMTVVAEGFMLPVWIRCRSAYAALRASWH